jgi:hypothetical protein
VALERIYLNTDSFAAVILFLQLFLSAELASIPAVVADYKEATPLMFAVEFRFGFYLLRQFFIDLGLPNAPFLP